MYYVRTYKRDTLRMRSRTRLVAEQRVIILTLSLPYSRQSVLAMMTTKELHTNPLSDRRRRSKLEGQIIDKRAQCKVRKPILRRSLRLELKKVAYSLPVRLAIEKLATSRLHTISAVKKVKPEPRPQPLKAHISSKSSVPERHSSPPHLGSAKECTAGVCSDVWMPTTDGSLVDSQDETDACTELEMYPVPSTHQQKEARRLARQRQLREMQARELAEARKTRLLRRQGLLVTEHSARGRHVVWAKHEELVRIHVYSPTAEMSS